MGVNVGDYLEVYICRTIEDSPYNGYSQAQVLYKAEDDEYVQITVYTGFSRYPEWRITSSESRDILYGWYEPGWRFKDEVW